MIRKLGLKMQNYETFENLLGGFLKVYLKMGENKIERMIRRNPKGNQNKNSCNFILNSRFRGSQMYSTFPGKILTYLSAKLHLESLNSLIQ